MKKCRSIESAFAHALRRKSSIRGQVAKMKVLNCLMPIGLAVKEEFLKCWSIVNKKGAVVPFLHDLNFPLILILLSIFVVLQFSSWWSMTNNKHPGSVYAFINLQLRTNMLTDDLTRSRKQLFTKQTSNLNGLSCKALTLYPCALETMGYNQWASQLKQRRLYRLDHDQLAINRTNKNIFGES